MITSIFPYSFANGDVMPCTVSQIPVVKDIKNYPLVELKS